MQERSEESLSRKPVAIGPRRRLSKGQVHRDTNAEKRDANATGDGDIVNSTDLRQALARQGGALSHWPERKLQISYEAPEKIKQASLTKLINSFHDATCLGVLLITKVTLEKQEPIELWFNYDQTKNKSKSPWSVI